MDPQGRRKSQISRFSFCRYDRYTDRYGRYGRYGRYDRYCEVFTAPVRAAKLGPAAKEV